MSPADRGGAFRDRLFTALLRMNIAISASSPYLSRRHPYRRRKKMVAALGPDLARPVTWAASDEPIDGDLYHLFEETADVTKWSQYFDVYEEALRPFRNRPVTMLEIGVSRGGSLDLWREYLHTGSTIVGVDIDPACSRFDRPRDNVHVRIGAQQDIAFLKQVSAEFGPFDVILDDGSHRSSHMVASFRELFPNALADGGVYIVEDIHANYWAAHSDQRMTFVDFTRWLIDCMHAHYMDADSERNFRVGDELRARDVTVPVATTIIGKIEFNDSIAVILRRPRKLPRSIFDRS